MDASVILFELFRYDEESQASVSAIVSDVSRELSAKQLEPYYRTNEEPLNNQFNCTRGYFKYSANFNLRINLATASLITIEIIYRAINFDEIIA